jgi:Tol biopolymer transport system component
MSHSDTTPRTFTADQLGAALNEVGGQARPDYLPDIVAQAGRTRQRPAWTFLERWLPMDIAARRQGVPRTVLVFAVLALLLSLLVATLAFIGTRPARPALASATNGLMAFITDGDVVVVGSDGTGRRAVARGAGAYGVAFSPDGLRLAYWAPADGATNDLIVIDADGSNPVTIASGILAPTAPAPAWSPDGSTIAFSARSPQPEGTTCTGAGGQNGDFCSSRIYLAASDGSNLRQVGDPALDARSPDWSPDGGTIAFGGGNATPTIGVHLYLMDADGSDVRQLSEVRGSDWAFVQVDWSHDGTKIAGQASAADNIREWDIWIIPVDGSAPSNVGAHAGGDEIVPTWAPDRDALAWWWNGVVLMEEGADPLNLPSEMGGVPVWSPDGRLLASTSESGILAVTDLAGNVVTTIEGAAGKVAWQPLFE